MLLTGVPESASFPALLVALAGAGAPLEAPAGPEPGEELAVIESNLDDGDASVAEELLAASFGPEGLGAEPNNETVGSVDGLGWGLSEVETIGTIEAIDAVDAIGEVDAVGEVDVVESLDVVAIDGLSQLVSQVVPQVAPTDQIDEVALEPSMTTRLSRDFVVRLERVADRMWNEHGLRIEIVEGFRSQARQEQLFAQGRTAPGPVVTWTTRSLHTRGAAADLFVDGAPVTLDAAALLSRVAEEEGLRTLYPFDSGHIQLDRPGFGAEMESEIPRPPRPRTGAPEEPASGVAKVAPVARVARPARPPGGEEVDLPDPNQLSRRPGPEVSGPVRTDAMHKAARTLTEVVQPSLVQAETPPTNQASTSRSSVSSGLAPSGPAAGSGELTPPRGDATDAVAHAPRMGESSAESVPAPALTPGSYGGAREVGESVAASRAPSATPVDPSAFEYEAPRSPIRRLHLPIEGLAGANSIDLGVRGSAVDGWLNVSDPALAAELRKSLHELRHQLGERGLEARAIGVRIVGGASGDGVSAPAETTSGRTGGEGTPGQEADAERQRSQRDRLSRDTRDRSPNPETRDTKEEG